MPKPVDVLSFVDTDSIDLLDFGIVRTHWYRFIDTRYHSSTCTAAVVYLAHVITRRLVSVLQVWAASHGSALPRDASPRRAPLLSPKATASRRLLVCVGRFHNFVDSLRFFRAELLLLILLFVVSYYYLIIVLMLIAKAGLYK